MLRGPVTLNVKKKRFGYPSQQLHFRRRLGGAMELDKLSVSGRPTNLDYSRARPYCAYSRCGWGLFGHFFLSSIISLFFLPLSGRRSDID